jgi:hypothetical protein
VAFNAVYGFDYSQLGLYVAPYFAARSAQLRAAWAEPNQTPSSPSQGGGGGSGGLGNPTPTPTPSFSTVPNPTTTPTPRPTSTPIVNQIENHPLNLSAFSGKSASLSTAQRAAISLKVTSVKPRQIICTAMYSNNTTTKDLAIFKLRAQNSCSYAKSISSRTGRVAYTSIKLLKAAKSSEIGKIVMTLKM